MSAAYSTVKTRLWIVSGGRCEFEGCNTPLWHDEVTLQKMNRSYVAHIIAREQNGPRGDQKQSKLLAEDIGNLMLLCDAHHRLIDGDSDEYSIERLHEMKRSHEERIATLTSLQKNRKSHVILYGANIGGHSFPLSWDMAVGAMLPRYYPAEQPAIEMSLINSPFRDHEPDYWVNERNNLSRQYADKVRPRLALRDVQHLSVFALAPQPLLIEFGRLLSDIPAAEVYQLHREPPNWAWQDRQTSMRYEVIEPEAEFENVALNLSLSATINDSRITDVLEPATSIWRMTIDVPNNDFLKHPDDLREFRRAYRVLIDRIKARHGQDQILHIFPAVPNSVAIEIGRVWMPKADMQYRVYDQNSKLGGFTPTLSSTIEEDGSDAE